MSGYNGMKDNEIDNLLMCISLLIRQYGIPNVLRALKVISERGGDKVATDSEREGSTQNPAG